MASKLEEQRVFMVALSQGEAILENDEQYAFAAGQVIYYLLHKSKTADKSYKRLEPFLQQVHASPDFVIVSPKSLRQRVLLFSDVLPSALFGCKSPCSEVA